MIISKFTKEIKINEEIYAIYNNLFMKVLFVNGQKYDDIKAFRVSNKEKKELADCKIYINNPTDDKKMLQKVIEEKNREMGKIKTMYLCVTSNCNLNCSYCFINNQINKNKKKDMMSTDVGLVAIKKFVNYLNSNGLTGKIVFYGGEPLINWQLIKESIELANINGYPIIFSIITNGTLLDIKKIKFLKNNNVNIGISIDGPKQINDKNRIFSSKNHSVYDSVITNINRLKKQQCNFGLSITLSEEIIANQDELLSWIKDLKVPNIAYNLLHFTWSYDKWEKYYENATKFVCKSYLELKNCSDGTIQNKINCIINENFKYFGCLALGLKQVVVKPNGDMCICHGEFRENTSTFTNINEFDFEKIYSYKETNKWEKIIPLNIPKCLNCEALFSCGGGCYLQSKTLFKYEKDSAMCIYNKLIIKFIIEEIYKLTCLKGGEN